MKKTKTIDPDSAQVPAVLPDGAVCKYFPIEMVIPTPENNRRIIPGDPRITELAKSIKASKQKVPCIGRPHPDKPGYIDQRAGARRHAACQEAGLKEVLVLVYPMSDIEALDVTILENQGRNDLTPIEQARGIQSMVKAGNTLEQIAAKFGEDLKWVKRRAKLADLSPSWSKALDNPKSAVYYATANHLELIARYEKDMQEKLFKELGQSDWVFRERKTEGIKQQIGRFMRDLSKVTWDLNDALLVPKAGACAQCPKRSSCNPTLFDTDEVTKDGDTCLDAACFTSKLDAALKVNLAAAKKETGKDVIMVATSHVDYNAHVPQGTLNHYDFDAAKAGDKGAVPALVVHGKNLNKLIYIKKRSYGGGPAKKKAAGKMTMVQKRKGLKLRRTAGVIRRLMALTDKAKYADLNETIRCAKSKDYHRAMQNMFALTVAWGTQHNYNKWMGSVQIPWSKLVGLTGEDLLEAAWKAVAPVISHSMLISGPINNISNKDIINAKEVAKLLGLSWDDMFAEEVKEIPEPKSWAKEQAEAAPSKKKTPATAVKKAKAKKPRKAKQDPDHENDGAGDDEDVDE